MTNDEIRRNDETRMTKPATAQLRAFRHSGLGFLSSLVIRHSTTYANQVHGVNACGKTNRGFMKSLLALRFAEAFGVVILLPALTARASEPNQLSDAEKQAGWKLLFDGQTTKGWRGYKQTAMPAKGWRV